MLILSLLEIALPNVTVLMVVLLVVAMMGVEKPLSTLHDDGDDDDDILCWPKSCARVTWACSPRASEEMPASVAELAPRSPATWRAEFRVLGFRAVHHGDNQTTTAAATATTTITTNYYSRC